MVSGDVMEMGCPRQIAIGRSIFQASQMISGRRGRGGAGRWHQMMKGRPFGSGVLGGGELLGLQVAEYVVSPASELAGHGQGGASTA